jgi:hypothetical protein
MSITVTRSQVLALVEPTVALYRTNCAYPSDKVIAGFRRACAEAPSLARGNYEIYGAKCPMSYAGLPGDPTLLPSVIEAMAFAWDDVTRDLAGSNWVIHIK